MRFESDREEAKSPIIMLVEVGLFVAYGNPGRSLAESGFRSGQA